MTTAMTAFRTSMSRRSRLAATIRPPATLSVAERRQLFDLFSSYFDGTTPDSFARDLAEKESIGLLIDREDGTIRGFTTLCRLHVRVDGRPVTAFFSGDTIVDAACRSETALGRRWLQHILDEAGEITDGPVYWFLISSGYKTYRLLPTLFNTFFPTFTAPTPDRLKRTIDALASARYQDGYDSGSGIIRLLSPTPLRVAEVPPGRSRDPHVAFFLAANPGHAAGDELACLAELSPANLTAIGRRLLGHTPGGRQS